VPDDAPYSGRCQQNPGTSSKVTSGMLNASQKRTNLAPLTDASMSSVPARFAAGWHNATERPARRANPTMMFSQSNAAPQGSTLIRHAVNEVEHLVRLVGRLRHEPVERFVFPIRGSLVATRGGSSRLLLGRKPSSSRISAGTPGRHPRRSARHRWWHCASSPRELLLADLLVRHVLITSARHEHVARIPDMMLKSVIAGE